MKIQCDSCGSVDFDYSGNNIAKCKYCGSTYILNSDESASQIGTPLNMPYEAILNGDVLTLLFVPTLPGNNRPRPPIVKVPKGTKVIEARTDGVGGIFERLNQDYWHYEATIQDGITVTRRIQDKLEEVILPEGLEVIGDRAFRGCTNLERVVIPSTVKIIGCDAFKGCKSLHEINLPNSLTEISNGAFENSGLRTITIPESIKKLSGFCFADCNELKEVVIPGSVKELSGNCFANCNGLKTVVLKPGVEEIGLGAFGGCKALESITLPNTLKKIGYHAENPVFLDCSSLKSLEIPNGVKYFDLRELSGCDNLEHLYIGDKTECYPPWGIQVNSRISFFIPPFTTRDWKEKGLCQYCGGSLVGFLTKKCSSCGKKKDY